MEALGPHLGDSKFEKVTFTRPLFTLAAEQKKQKTQSMIALERKIEALIDRKLAAAAK